jgi:ribosomal protein S18 acetylase RimI-like enzyme
VSADSFVVVRDARPDEYARVGELTIDAYKTLERDHLEDGYDDEILAVASRAQSAHVLVAVDANDVVLGACTFVTDPESPWMEWAKPDETQLRLLAVDVSARDRGVGRALVEACVERTNALGRPMLLHTTQFMPSAARLYERLGFRRAPERDVGGYEPYEFRGYVYPGRVTRAG